MRYGALIAYDGTAYHGWQIQEHCTTIAGTLTHAFRDAFKVDAHILGASRTDAGVHALGQFACITTPLNIDPETLKTAWNGRLPRDIRIRAMYTVPEHFHPLVGVRQKTYHYHFFEQMPLPFVGRYGMRVKNRIDQVKLAESLTVFIGTHDFRSFCTGDEAASTIRTIDSIELDYFKRFRTHRISVRGPGFLRYMIRRIVGAALDCAADPTKNIESLVRTLEARDPHHRLPVAQARGLMLRRIQYHPEHSYLQDTHE